MMSRTFPLTNEVVSAMSSYRFRRGTAKEDKEILDSIVPISSPESEDTEEEEIATRFKAIKASNPVFGMIPAHCSSFLPPRIDPATPKRDPVPTRVIDADECFDTCPKIMSREEWGAMEPNKTPAQLNQRVRPAIFKETEPHNCMDQPFCAQCVKFLQTFHIMYRNWDDVAFNFLIGGDGSIFEGRGWGVESEKNQKFCSIAYLGRYVARDPTEEPLEPMLRSTYNLIMCGVKKGFLKNPFASGKYHGNTPEEIIRDFIIKNEKVDYMSKNEEVVQVCRHIFPNMRIFRAINFSCFIGVIISFGVIIHSLIDTYEKINV